MKTNYVKRGEPLTYHENYIRWIIHLNIQKRFDWWKFTKIKQIVSEILEPYTSLRYTGCSTRNEHISNKWYSNIWGFKKILLAKISRLEHATELIMCEKLHH